MMMIETEITFTLSVFWSPSQGESRNTMFGKTQVDTAYPIGEPLTNQEMQDIAFAAKMAFGKVMSKRRKAAKK